MALPKFKPLENLDEGQKKAAKPLLIGALVVLLGAFGLTASSTDLDLNKLFSTGSVQQSVIRPTQLPSKASSKALVTPVSNKKITIKRDQQGKFLPENCTEDAYNCANFQYQEDAQEMFEKCGGLGHDVNRLDGNKDGKACESLPTRK